MIYGEIGVSGVLRMRTRPFRFSMDGWYGLRAGDIHLLNMIWTGVLSKDGLRYEIKEVNAISESIDDLWKDG
jgi:hypothetical protein